MNMNTNCPVCDTHHESADSFTVKEMLYGTGTEFRYVLCNWCGCVFLAEVPSDIGKYYQGYYTGSKQYYRLGKLKKIFWRTRSRLAVAGLFPLIHIFSYNTMLHWAYLAKIKFNSPILDVGCGNGDILFEFSKHGFTNLTGIDPYPQGEKSSLFQWNFEKTDMPEFNTQQKFDLIMFNHSLEHVPDHESILKKCKSLLTDKGMVMIRIPIVNKAFSDYRENWVQLDAPRHLLLHSLKSFRHLCDKAGYGVEKIFYDSTELQFMGSEQYKRGIPLYSEKSYKSVGSAGIFTSSEMESFRKKAKEYNKKGFGDQAVFFIRKVK